MGYGYAWILCIEFLLRCGRDISLDLRIVC